jgi:hypothetical protein
MKHLQDATIGSGPVGRCPRGNECSICAQAKASAIISYETPDSRAKEPGFRLVCDWFDPGHESDFGEKRIFFAFDEYTGKVWAYFEAKNEGDIVGYIRAILCNIQNLYGIRFRFIRMDKEVRMSKIEMSNLQDELGFELEIVPTATPAQGGSYERAGGIILKISRSIFIATKLPYGIWPEIVYTAMLFHNLLPTERLKTADNGWRSPDQAWHEFVNKGLGRQLFIEKPDISFFRALGCRAYPLNEIGKAMAEHKGVTKQMKARYAGGRKFAPRAHIGYLVGYGQTLFRRHSTNIFRIYVPGLGIRALATRDVTFDETQFFDPKTCDIMAKMTPAIAAAIDAADVLPTLEDFENGPFSVTTEPLPEELFHPPDKEQQNTAAAAAEAAAAEGVEDSPAEKTKPVEGVPDETEGVPDETEDPTHSNNLDDIQDTIICAPDSPPLDGEQPEEADETSRYPTPPDEDDEDPDDLLQAAIRKTSSLYAETGHAQSLRFHRRDMPPAPQGYKTAKASKFWPQWEAAMKKELKGLEEKGTYIEVDFSEAEQRPLDLMWVYAYKFDDFGYVSNFKARLVVRGDQMTGAKSDNYAYTLAAKTFRLLLATAAFFGLILHQVDAVAAFLNADLQDIIHVKHPPGFYTQGKCLRLLKALYGLPQSPRRWYDTLTKVLIGLGLQIIAEDPCVATNNWLIVFFFVDDIVLMFRPEDNDRAMKFKTDLMRQFELKDLGPLKWFLGMRITRNETMRKIWLTQDAYIADVARRFGLDGDNGGYPKTPRTAIDISAPPDSYEASPSFIYLFQRKVGSLTYMACMTRPDLAEATGQLAQFLTRPTTLLMILANRVIRYAYLTRFLSLEYGGKLEDLQSYMKNASDASFGNNHDRKSTQGFIMSLFGGAILWKSIKQPTTATSTTEAELLALSAAAKELLALGRLIRQLQLKLPDGATQLMLCDNLQTVRIVTETLPKVTTRLRHVDIQQHWLREAVRNGSISVQWIRTSDMPADGLTKALPIQKHQLWLKNIGMTDLESQITASG